MSPNEIKAAIALAGSTQTALAAYLGVSMQSVSRVINGRLRSTRIEAELAKIIGKPPFGALPKRGRPKSSWNGTGQVA